MVVNQKLENEEAGKRGERAEIIANWYFRLNGFFLIPGFIVHPDEERRGARTEADIIGVRFAYSFEEIAYSKMSDDPLLTQLTQPKQTLFIIVEVKTGRCELNSPWTNSQKGNMQRVIRRIGFVSQPINVEHIAQIMYRDLRWQSKGSVMQYIAIGKEVNPHYQNQYPKLVQITWKDIAKFLYRRFADFPEKLPYGPRSIHKQWPDFGKEYGEFFWRMNSEQDSYRAIDLYIKTGKCRED